MPVQISHHLAKEATGVIVKNHSLPNSLWLGPVPHPSLSTLWDREISRVSDGFRRQHFYCDPVSGESNLKLRLPMGRTIVAEGAVPQLNTRPYPRNMESFFFPWEILSYKDPGLHPQNKWILLTTVILRSESQGGTESDHDPEEQGLVPPWELREIILSWSQRNLK